MNRLLIKKQAKASLKGKWGKAIGLCLVGTILMMIVPSIFYAIGLSSSVTKQTDAGVKVVSTGAVGAIFFILALIAIAIIIPLFAYGISKAFLTANRGGDFTVGNVFDGFKEKPGKTIGAGFLSFIIIYLCYAIPSAIAGFFLGTAFARIATIKDILETMTHGRLVFVIQNLGPRLTMAFIFFIVAIVLGVIATYMYRMIYYVRVDNPDDSVVQVLKKSRKVMHGHKIDLFVLGVTFIGWHIVCMVTCGIGYLWLVPYMSAAEAAFYDQAKNDMID